MPFGERRGLTGDEKHPDRAEGDRPVGPEYAARTSRERDGRSGDDLVASSRQRAGERLEPTGDAAVEAAEEEFRKDIDAGCGMARARASEEPGEETHPPFLRQKILRLGSKRSAEAKGEGGRGGVRGTRAGTDEKRGGEDAHAQPEKKGTRPFAQRQKKREKEGVGGEAPRPEPPRPRGGSDQRTEGIERTEGWEGRERECDETGGHESERCPPACEQPGRRSQKHPKGRHARRPPRRVTEHRGKRGNESREASDRVADGHEEPASAGVDQAEQRGEEEKTGERSRDPRPDEAGQKNGEQKGPKPLR